MKEIYFLPGDMEGKALGMIREVENAGGKRDLFFTPERSALLVLDMQSYFLDASSHAFVPSAPAILPGVRNLMDAYVFRNLPVILTRHINNRRDAGMMAKWWRELITEDNPLSMIDPQLACSSSLVIKKSRYDAFYDTRLEDVLRDMEVERVVVCGVMTHLCCETTARSAFMRGFEVFFTADGTVTYNERFHRAALLNLAHGFAKPVMVKELLSALQEYADD